MVGVAGATSNGALQASGFPQGTLLDQLFQEFNGVREDKNRVLRVTINEPLERLRDECTILSQEQLAALQETIQQKSLLSTWSYGSFASSILYATSTILGGAYLKWTEKENGDQFIYAGTVSLANTLLTHTKGWAAVSKLVSLGNKNVEQLLQTVLPLAVTLFTYAWNGRNIATLTQDQKEKMELINHFFSFVGIVLQVGEIYTKFRVGVAEIKRQEIDTTLNVKNYEFNGLLARQGGRQDSFDKVGQDLKGMIRNAINSNADCAKVN